MNIEDYIQQVGCTLRELGYRIDEVYVDEHGAAGVYGWITMDSGEDYPADSIGWSEKNGGWFWESDEPVIDGGEFGGPTTPPVEEIVPRIATFLSKV